jgi:hypothetical protein
MKRSLQLLLVALALTTTALAQSSTSKTTDGEAAVTETTARCAYIQNGEQCANAIARGPELAQFPRSYPRRMQRPRAGNYGYPGMYPAPNRGRHVIIGALIGFGLGAAIGARNNGHVGGTLGLGCFLGAIGAGVGATAP